jgi:hypothetical protein
VVGGQSAHCTPFLTFEVFQIPGEATATTDVDLSGVTDDDNLTAIVDSGQHLL